jgi:hypothetical protein
MKLGHHNSPRWLQLQRGRRRATDEHNVVTSQQNLIKLPVAMLLLAAPACAGASGCCWCLWLLLLLHLLLQLAFLLLLGLPPMLLLAFLLLLALLWLLLLLLPSCHAVLQADCLLLHALHLDHDCVRLLNIPQQQVYVSVKGNDGPDRPASDTNGMPGDNIHALPCCMPLGQCCQGPCCCYCQGHDVGEGPKLDAGFCSLGCLQGTLLERCCFGLLCLRLQGRTRQEWVRLVEEAVVRVLLQALLTVSWAVSSGWQLLLYRQRLSRYTTDLADWVVLVQQCAFRAKTHLSQCCKVFLLALLGLLLFRLHESSTLADVVQQGCIRHWQLQLRRLQGQLRIKTGTRNI